MTQVNTPYPATAYLHGFLRARGIDATQDDPALRWFLRIYSRQGLTEILQEIQSRANGSLSPAVVSFAALGARYIHWVEPVIRFLQGRDPELAHRLVRDGELPEGPRFKTARQIDGWAWRELGLQDRAKFVASLFVDDLADAIREGVDERFGLSRYAEKLAASQPSFDGIRAALQNPNPGLLDRWLDEEGSRLAQLHAPELVVLTAPFPGNVYAAFRLAQVFKRHNPSVKIALGGGYVNTELRELKDPRVFDLIDFLCLDDGERPLLCLIEHLEGKRPWRTLKRTALRWAGRVVWVDGAVEDDVPSRDLPAPSYAGLPLDQYVSLLEVPNPMHRLWSDGRWLKLTLAHGCYWRKCSFCDVTLDYIGRYDPTAADALVDRIEAMVAETGLRGFHIVDEAAPPALLRALAERLIARGVQITWWGNVRFEKTFTPELARLLARSGCVAVSGGLEVASDRLLKLMNKGVSVDQVARVTHALTQAGILVHAYLMYGFPTQTVRETVEALERVRQLFAAGCIQSAYWHRFSVTCHSPIGKDPGAFGIRLLPEAPTSFARNDLAFIDPSGAPHDELGMGLKRALYNFLRGAGLDWDVRRWFVELTRLPEPRVPEDLVERALLGQTPPQKDPQWPKRKKSKPRKKPRPPSSRSARA